MNRSRNSRAGSLRSFTSTPGPVILNVMRYYKPHGGPFSQIARKSFPQQHRPKSVWEFQQ